MSKVISITREKTALIFPNAIGFQTAEDKVSILNLNFHMTDNARKCHLTQGGVR